MTPPLTSYFILLPWCFTLRNAPPHAWLCAAALMVLHVRCLSATQQLLSLLDPPPRTSTRGRKGVGVLSSGTDELQEDWARGRQGRQRVRKGTGKEGGGNLAGQ